MQNSIYRTINAQEGVLAKAGLLVFWLILSNFLVAQSDFSADRRQISQMLAGLSDHSIKPADVLDPSLDPAKRRTSLGYFRDPTYQLTLVPISDIKVSPSGSATVPVTVRFKNENKEVSVQTTAEFVKRNQVWYFANFDFVAFPPIIVAVIVVGILVAIFYASGVLLLRRKLLRQGELNWNNRTKIFIPIFWPSIFRKR